MKALALALALCTLGCQSVYVDLPTPDPSTLDLDRGRRIRSKHCGFALFTLIPMGVNNRLDKVWSRLRRQAGRDVIADVQLREAWDYAGVGSLWCSELVATAYPRLER